ncbi:MAG: 4Fe-4S ferredoxin, iron-sulfur binding domain protein [Desulfacinum sp.]|jgi:Fe-S-cluster-containing hydrogenase component 2|nr:4Fe-4S ferredoxin, iron-sulfur binding domain protein [Desulfacinum sp.]
MCQFCHQHGEGKKWYHNAANYAEDLLNDLERRRYIQEFVYDVATDKARELEETFQRALKVPRWLREIGYRFYEQKYRRDHFGQVIPKEDLHEVYRNAGAIVRLPCVCRKSSTGAREARYCIGLTLDPEKLLEVKEAFLETFRFGPHVDPFERLTAEQAMALTEDFEKEGLIHTIWTFKTPFIGAVCNCDRADCLAMKAYQYQFRLFFRGEYVARVDEQRCIGCRRCAQACQFGALGYSAHRRTAFVDPLRCYGCGICRAHCEQEAISLQERAAHPRAASLW